MTRRVISLLGMVLATGCAEQIRYGTDQTRSTIPEILEDQALNNAARAFHDPLAIPAQLVLTNSVTQAVNSVNAGIAPNIALRAIAITGIALTSQNSVSQNWSANAVTDYLDLKRLSVFYSYAVHPSAQTFDQFEATLNTLTKWKSEGATKDDTQEAKNANDGKKGAASEKSKPPNLSVQIGRLPPSGFIIVNDPGRCQGGLESPAYQSNISFPDRLCFRPHQKVDGSDTEISPRALMSLFVLWSVAIPTLGVTDDRNKSNLVIPVAGPS